MALLVSCSDVSHEYNFAEFIEANYKFRTSREKDVILDKISGWALKNGFTKETESDDLTSFHLLLSPGEPRFFSKLFLYPDAHGSNSLSIELKTDRWGNREAHRRQRVVTESLRTDFGKLFPGNFRVDVVVRERDGVPYRTNEHIPLDASFPGIK